MSTNKETKRHVNISMTGYNQGTGDMWQRLHCTNISRLNDRGSTYRMQSNIHTYQKTFGTVRSTNKKGHRKRLRYQSLVYEQQQFETSGLYGSTKKWNSSDFFLRIRNRLATTWHESRGGSLADHENGPFQRHHINYAAHNFFFYLSWRRIILPKTPMV